VPSIDIIFAISQPKDDVINEVTNLQQSDFICTSGTTNTNAYRDEIRIINIWKKVCGRAIELNGTHCKYSKQANPPYPS